MWTHSKTKNPAPSNAALSDEAEIRVYSHRSLLHFMKAVWWQPTPLLVGIHTELIAREISRAVDRFKRGESSFLCISVPFRHGKSDMVSRALPAWFVGACSDIEPDVISTGYGADLVAKFSRKSRTIVAGKKYQRIFPDVRLSTKRTDALWKVDYKTQGDWKQSTGDVTVTGLGGALTGSGYHLGILDDFCKSRAEAESATYRNKVWEAFTNDFLTRRAPVSVTIVTATSWHVDDIIGRIRKEMKENSEFPRFQFITFPARGSGWIGEKQIPYGEREYLFEERFGAQWYKEQYASLGTYGAAGLLDCDPTVQSGNIFPVDKIVVHNSIKEFPACRYVRFWDVASTEKEVAKDDPDYTVGALCGITREKGNGGDIVPHLWISDVTLGQWRATRRNERIRAIAGADGAAVRVLVESVGGYKDAVDQLATLLKGVRSVTGVNVSRDKAIRAAPLEPLFEAGHVHILRAPWNDMFLRHFREFPFGVHDDIVDAVSGAYNHLVEDKGLQLFDRRLVGA